jgi:thiol-disulfide isomerase/thioredoxin
VSRRGAARAAGLALTLACLAPGGAAAQANEAGIALGGTPPPVTIQDLRGRPVSLERLIGDHPALIEFWATWCPRCRALAPKLKALHARYGGRVRFVAVAVAVNETRAGVRRHLAEHPMPYPFLWDGDGTAVRAFQAPTTSYVVILDRRHRVVYTGVGVDQDLAGALAGAVRAD